MATENITIQIREDGSRVVVRNINDIGKAAGDSHKAVNSLKTALAGLAGALGLNQIREWMDTWTRAVGQVNSFASSMAETNVVMQKLYQIAQDVRQPIDGIAKSYHQLTIAASSLGASQNQLIAFTEAIGKALAIQGTDANTARGGIIQLGQAMNEGIVRAQEYNSMINSMPMVLRIVAKNLDGVDGSLAKLRQRMLDGKLYSKDFFEALLKGAGDLDSIFNRTGKTIGQSLTIVNNAMAKYAGEVDRAYGISEKFYKVAKLASENIDTLAKSLAVAGSPLVVRGLMAVGSAIMAIGAAAMANPFTAIAMGVAAAITALTVWRDELVVSQEHQTTVGDYMRASWELLGEAVSNVASWMVENFGGAYSVIAEIFSKMYNGGKFFINGLVGLFVGVGKTIGIALAAVPDVVGEIFVDAMNMGIRAVERGINRIITAVNAVSGALGIDAIANVTLEQVTNDYRGKTEAAGTAIREAFENALATDYIGEAVTGAVEMASRALDGLNQKARDFALQRREDSRDNSLAKMLAEAGLGTPGGPGEDYSNGGKDKKAAKEMEKLENQLRKLLNTIKPAEGALLEYKHAQDVLTKAVEKNLITEKDKIRYLELVKLHYEDVIDPLRAYYRESNKEIDQLTLFEEKRNVEIELHKKVMELKKQGILLSEAETEELRKQISAVDEANRLANARQQLYNQFVSPQETFNRGLKAANQLLNEGVINIGQYNDAVRDMRIEYLETQKDFESGFERAILRVQKEYEDVAAMADNLVSGFFGRFEDAIDKFVDTGKLSFKDFFKGIFADIAKLELKMMFLGRGSVLGNLANMVGGGGGGNVAGALANGGGGMMGTLGNALSIGSSLYGVGTALWNGAMAGGAAGVANVVGQVGTWAGTAMTGGTAAVSTGAMGTGWVAAEGGMAYGAGAGAAGAAGSGGMMSGISTALANIPVWGWILLAILVFGKKLFGHKLVGAGIEGAFSDAGFSGSSYQFKKGGMFRSDKTTYDALPEEAVNGLNDAAEAIGEGFSKLGGQIGAGSDIMKDFNFSFRLALRDFDDEGKVKETQRMMSVMTDRMAIAFVDKFRTSVNTADVARNQYWTNTIDGNRDFGAGEVISKDRTNSNIGAFADDMIRIFDKFRATVEGVEGQEGKLADFMMQLFSLGATLANTTAITKLFGKTITLPELETAANRGENVMQTFARLAQVFEVTNNVAITLGKNMATAFGEVGIASAKARTSLIEMAGGAEALVNKTSFFAQNFLSMEQQMAPVLTFVSEKLAELGLSGIKTTQDYAAKVTGLNLAIEADRKLYIELMNLAPAFLQATKYLDSLKESTEDVGEAAEKTAALVKGLLEDAQDLADKWNADRDTRIGRAESELEKAYERESQALIDVAERAEAAAKSLREYSKSLLTSDLSTLSPEQKYNQLKSEFESTYTSALAGDPIARDNLQQVAQAFLESSRGYYASSEGHTQNFDRVRDALSKVANVADTQAQVARDELSALTNLVSGQINLNNSVLSVRDAIIALQAARAVPVATPTSVLHGGAGAPDPNLSNRVLGLYAGYAGKIGSQIDNEGLAYWTNELKNKPYEQVKQAFINSVNFLSGSHENGLNTVPYNGYIAELHRNEAVLTASEADDWREGRMDEVVELLEVAVVELRAANTQRAAVGTESIDKLNGLTDRIEALKREQARSPKR